MFIHTYQDAVSEVSMGPTLARCIQNEGCARDAGSREAAFESGRITTAY